MARKANAPKILPFSNAFNFSEAREQNRLGQKLTELRKERKMTMDDLQVQLHARGIDVGRTAICKWELGQNVPGGYQLLALCDVFDLDDPLLFFTDRSELNNEGLRKIAEYKKVLIASGLYAPEAPEEEEEECAVIRMPVHLLSVSAGTGNFLDEDNFEMEEFPEDSVPRGADFGVRVHGDSMEPVYHDGQIVWVKKSERIRRGEVGVFCYDGDGYLKMFDEKTPDDPEEFTDSRGVLHPQSVLVSYNSNYDPIEISPESAFQIVGRVL